ncbi:hypothetical protein [Arthrobacter polaris]|uniref:hypothetical protein n=1 Tax=Arthrobacter polaris TaxID=2813727 RepID=UPI001F17D17A|nr:hypothetical protein [Arthrobacter polaris]UIK87990.1 hypothetical protein J0916_11020 [Arthrobacter polaris]
MECTVTSVRAAADRFGYNGVVFETTDCGKLGFSAGVTEDNSAEIAAQIVVGARYTFEIGAGTRSMMGFFQSINITPTVYSFKSSNPLLYNHHPTAIASLIPTTGWLPKAQPELIVYLT